MLCPLEHRVRMVYFALFQREIRSVLNLLTVYLFSYHIMNVVLFAFASSGFYGTIKLINRTAMADV